MKSSAACRTSENWITANNASMPYKSIAAFVWFERFPLRSILNNSDTKAQDEIGSIHNKTPAMLGNERIKPGNNDIGWVISDEL